MNRDEPRTPTHRYIGPTTPWGFRHDTQVTLDGRTKKSPIGERLILVTDANGKQWWLPKSKVKPL